MGRTFVGRERELAFIRSRLEDALGGRSGLVLLSGEAGIGKTRLAEEAGREAATRGALVVWGRSWEEGGAPPYWPWVQIVRGISDAAPDARVFALEVLPLLERASSDRADAPSDPGAARFELFDATTRFLRRAAVSIPVTAIVDDLHAADAPSLHMLRFVARSLRDSPIFLIGTYREAEARRDPEIAQVLGGIAREGESLPLRGLSAGEVGGYVERFLGRAPSAEFTESIRARTEGNPLFVDELVRVLAAEGGLDDASASVVSVEPRGIAETIRQRLALLSDESRRALRAAAVVGREFDASFLALCAGIEPTALRGLLDEAVAASEVEPVAAAGLRYRFVHVLIRDALYSELTASERTRLHIAAAEALEASAAADARAAEIARHRFEALPAGDPALATSAARRAAVRAEGLIAYEEASVWYERALEIPPGAGPEAAGERCDLLLALGSTRMKAGHVESAREAFGDAADAARSAGDPGRLASAALGYASRLGYAKVDTVAIRLLGDAMSHVGEEPSATRSRLCAVLARALYMSPERERMGWLADESIRVAGLLDDPTLLAEALAARAFTLRGPDTPEERVAVANEIVRLAARTGVREHALDGHLMRMAAHLELGNPAACDEDIESYVTIAEDLHQPRYLLYATVRRAMRAFMDGRFAEGDRLARDARTLAERIDDPDADPVFNGVTFVPYREFGKLEEALAGHRELSARYAGSPYSVMTAAIVALLLCDLGRIDEARAAFKPLEPRAIARNSDWMFTMAVLAETAAAERDVERSRIFYDHLLPYRERHVVLATAVGYGGSVERLLGLTAAAAGLTDEAESHLRKALEAHERMRARTWIVRSQVELAEFLVGAGRAGDEAARLAGAARVQAEEIGATLLLDRSLALGAPRPVRAAEFTAQEASFLRQGKEWRISFEGAALSLKPQKGLDVLAHLLRHPGREFHVLDLVALEQPSSGHRGRTAVSDGLSTGRLGDAGEILDPQAKAAYKRRLDDLRAELAEAEEWGDAERTARAREEMEALVDALAAGVGLGGRARRAGSTAERARVSVRKALTAAIRRVAREHSSLGRYLETTVRTGTYCSFVPDPRFPVSWKA